MGVGMGVRDSGKATSEWQAEGRARQRINSLAD